MNKIKTLQEQQYLADSLIHDILSVLDKPEEQKIKYLVKARRDLGFFLDSNYFTGDLLNRLSYLFNDIDSEPSIILNSLIKYGFEINNYSLRKTQNV